jgi:hypothetical protein
MRRDAGVCPHCRAESIAWTLKDGAWWCQAESGWQRLDEKKNEWIAWEKPAEPEAVI